MLRLSNANWFPHPNFSTLPLSRSFLFSAYYFWGPRPAKHISKWQLLLLTSKKLGVVDFPRPNVASLRTEEERWGPRGQWWFVWGTAGKGSRIRMWRTLAVSRLIQDHWFLLLFSFLLDMICIANGSSVALAFFWSQKRVEGGGGWEDRGFPHHTPPPVVPALVPGSHRSCLSPSLPGLLLTTTGSLLGGEEAWTTPLPYRNRIVSPHRTIRSKKENSQSQSSAF